MTQPRACLVPVPETARAGAASDDALADVAALRPLDPALPTRLVAPVAVRDRVRAVLEAQGYQLAPESAPLDAGTPLAGVTRDQAARLLDAPVDQWEPSPAARPLLAHAAFAERPRGTPLAEHARARARADASFALAVERAARESDAEGIVAALELTRGQPSPEVAAFVRHRVAAAAPDAAALARMAGALASDARAGIAPAAREALGFATRRALALPGLLALEGTALARELDVALGDAWLAAPVTAALPPLADRLALAIRKAAPEGDLPRAARAAVAFARALAAPRGGDRGALDQAAETLGALGATADVALALALAEKHGAALAPVERRRHWRRLARAFDEDARRAVETALPELASADRIVAQGLAAETRASSRAELVSTRRRACALALARAAELATDEPARRTELERARALLERARAEGRERGLELDWELVALALDEALLAADGDRTPLGGRARAAIDRWATSTERPPLGFLGGALRLLVAAGSDDPFPGELRDARRVEVRALFHLARRVTKDAEVPRDLVEALLERRRSGVHLAELAKRLDPLVAGALLFAALPRSLAATLSDELGRADEVRIFRRRPGSDEFEGRFERAFVTVRFQPDDDPSVERARSLVRPASAGPAGVARPVAALEAARVRGGLGIGWALVVARPSEHPLVRLAPEDVPQGAQAWPFLAAVADALAAQHAWGLVHGQLRLDALAVALEPAGPRVVLTAFDLEGSLGDAATGRARDLETLLAAAAEALGPEARAIDELRASAGDLALEGAAAKLARAFEARAPGRLALGAALARRAVDAAELRALLRDVLAGDPIARSLAEVEARVPAYLSYRAAVTSEVLRHELLELVEEGWASGDFSVEVDARTGSWRLLEGATA